MQKQDGKATPTIRRLWIEEQLMKTSMWPSASQLRDQFPGLAKSTAFEDIKIVAKKMFSGVEVEKVRAQVLARLAVRIPVMKDCDLIRLAVSLFPQPQEIKSQIEVKARVGVAIVELLKQYDSVLEKAAGGTIQTDDP